MLCRTCRVFSQTPNSKMPAVDPISFLNYHRSNMYIIYSIYIHIYIYIDPFYLVLMYLLALESLVKYCIYSCWWLKKRTHSQHLWDDEPRSQCRIGRPLQVTELETTLKRSTVPRTTLQGPCNGVPAISVVNGSGVARHLVFSVQFFPIQSDPSEKYYSMGRIIRLSRIFWKIKSCSKPPSQ